MREFNTSGPCNPALHYTVMREALIAKGKENVQKGRFFTLFAPRQAGKTTYFQLLLNVLKDDGYIPMSISFESMKVSTQSEFYAAVNHRLCRALTHHGITCNILITSAVTLGNFFEKSHLQDKSIVLVIDEFEGIPDALVSEVMHAFREIYHHREYYALHSLILVGVSTIAELVLSSASPFNIADDLALPYFTNAEVQDLIQQYMTESGQIFEPHVTKAIFDNTHGQPGLVCALCYHLITEVVTDRSQPVTMDAFYHTLDVFLRKRLDKNIVNIVQKARERKRFMLKVLFQTEPIPFSLYDPDIAWLAANGVVDEADGYTDVTVPLYKKVLVTTFRPLINGESVHYLTSAHESTTQYMQNDGRLNINALLDAYRAYVKRRGYHAFDTENLREAACHYSLDGFITFFLQQINAQSFVEIPSGRGRIDLLIRYQNQSYVIEIKVFSTPTAFKQGKVQLVAYLQSEGLDEGYYVVFSNLHTEADDLFTEEVIDSKRIFTHIILTKFDRPSELPVPDELKG